MDQEKRSIELFPILNLPPVNMEQMDPYALNSYLEYLQELYTELPGYELTEADLTDDEKAERKQCTDEIRDWIKKCEKGAGEANTQAPSILYCRQDLDALKALLEAAYERKASKLKKQAEEKRRLGALEEIDPPLDDAREYLRDREYKLFVDSLPGAVDAYLSNKKQNQIIPDIWRADPRARDYVGTTAIIESRKKREAQERQAQFEFAQYQRQIDSDIKKLKQELAREKKPRFPYPAALAKYQPHTWCELERPAKPDIAKWAWGYIWKRVPPTLKDFISWEVDWREQMLPYAEYEVAGIPCLVWYFRTLILAEVHLRVVEKTTIREFLGYRGEIAVPGCEVGCFYVVPPVEWDTQLGFTTPIALLSVLAKGQLEAPGVTVIERSSPFTRFVVQGLSEQVELHDAFRRFISDISKERSLSQSLLAQGWVDEDTAKLIEGKDELPLPQLAGVQISTTQTTIDNSALEATLESLGYRKQEVTALLASTDFSPNMTPQDKLQAVLKNIRR